MAQTKEIKKKIGSVQNTKKITSAMELVASSKMKKTQDAMKKGKPYSQKIIELIDNLAGASSEYKHPFFKSNKPCRSLRLINTTELLNSANLLSNMELILKVFCRGIDPMSVFSPEGEIIEIRSPIFNSRS